MFFSHRLVYELHQVRVDDLLERVVQRDARERPIDRVEINERIGVEQLGIVESRKVGKLVDTNC